MHEDDATLAKKLSNPTRWHTCNLRQHLRSQRCTLLPLVLALLLLLAYREYQHSNDGIFLTSDDYPVDWKCPPPLPAAQFPPSRVLILSTDDRPLPATSELPEDVSQWPYYLLTHHLNRRYAARHGYAYQRLTDVRSQRSVVWDKVYHVLHAVDWAAYDYIVAVDSDAWFTHSRLALHDMLHCFSPDWLPAPTPPPTATPDFLISHDYPVHASRRDDLNAGVWLLRTTPRARAVLQQWWQLAELPQHAHFRHEWPAEQGVLNELLMKNETTAAAIRALPRQVIYGHAAAYISHVTSWWPRQRGWEGRREQLIMRDIVRADIEDAPG